MQIESLKVFCDLAETQSFTRAAEINAVTQSAVSQTISTMERQFNALLAERSRKNFRLTREGQVVYDYGKELLQAFATLEARMKEARTVASGYIRLAVIPSVGLHNLPPCLRQFSQAQPTVEVRVEYRRAAQVYDDVLGHAADLGVVAYPWRNPKLRLIPLRSEPLVLICHPRHPLAKSRSVRLAALNGEKLLGFGPELPSGRALHRLLRAQRVVPESMVDFDSIDTLKSAVEIDAGVAVVPQPAVVQEVAGQSLAAVPLEGDYARPLAVIHRKQMALSPGMTELIALMKQAL